MRSDILGIVLLSVGVSLAQDHSIHQISNDDRAEGYGPARNPHAAAMQRAVEQARPQNVDFPVEEQNGQREGGRGGKKKGYKGMLPSFVTAAGVEASKAFVAILRNFSQTFAEQKQAFDAWGGQYNATEQVNEWYQNITTKADANTQDIIAKMATVLQKMQELKDANPEMTIAEYFEAVKAWVNSTNDENTRAAARWVMMIRGESLGFGEKCHKMGGHSHGGDSHERTEDDRTGGERNGSGGRRDREGNHREGGRGSRRHGHSRGTRATRSWTHRRGTGKTTKTPKATARAG